jgi:small subunit ribosomal protein S17
MIRTLRGKVVSDKMDKTVVVAVSSSKEHPIYRKKYNVTTRFKAHDPKNEYPTTQSRQALGSQT